MLVGKTPFVVIVSFSPMGFSAAIVSINTQGVLHSERASLPAWSRRVSSNAELRFWTLLWILNWGEVTPTGVSSTRSGVVFLLINKASS